jgi:hypothetical protein
MFFFASFISQESTSHNNTTTSHDNHDLTRQLSCLSVCISPMISISNLFFSGEYDVHIVGTMSPEQERSCPCHLFSCGLHLRPGDWVVFHLISLASKGLDEQAIEVRWVVNGLEMCCMGFLQRSYIPLFHRYIDEVEQVREVWDSSDESPTKRRFVHHNVGCCVAGIVVNHRNPNIEDSFDNQSSSGDDSDNNNDSI